MSIVNFSPYRQYIYSPISYIHQINIIFKLSFIILYLLNIIYIPKIMLLLIFIYSFICFLLMQYLQLKSKYKNQFLQIISIHILLLIIFIIISNNMIAYNYTAIQMHYPSILQKQSNIALFIIFLRSYNISVILFKTIFVLYNTISILQLLFYTTKLEEIIILFLYVINFIIQFRNLFYIIFMFSCSLASQFIYIVINQVKDNNISIKIRKINRLNIKYLICYYYFIFFLNQILNSIENITYALYNKEITKKSFYLISI